MSDYARRLAAEQTVHHPDTIKNEDGGSHPTVPIIDGTLREILEAIGRGRWSKTLRREVYIELDWAILSPLLNGEGEPYDLLPYLRVAAVRVDLKGDVILHVTNADRLMFS